MALLREAGIGAVAGPAVATISDNLEDTRAPPRFGVPSWTRRACRHVFGPLS